MSDNATIEWVRMITGFIGSIAWPVVVIWAIKLLLPTFRDLLFPINELAAFFSKRVPDLIDKYMELLAEKLQDNILETEEILEAKKQPSQNQHHKSAISDKSLERSPREETVRSTSNLTDDEDKTTQLTEERLEAKIHVPIHYEKDQLHNLMIETFKGFEYVINKLIENCSVSVKQFKNTQDKIDYLVARDILSRQEKNSLDAIVQLYILSKFYPTTLSHKKVEEFISIVNASKFLLEQKIKR